MWLVCSSYKCQFTVSCSKLKCAANVKFLCIITRRCCNKPHIWVLGEGCVPWCQLHFCVFRHFPTKFFQTSESAVFNLAVRFGLLFIVAVLRRISLFYTLTWLAKKTPSSFIIPARLSVRLYVSIYHSNFHWIDFRGMWYCGPPRKSIENLQIWLKYNKKIQDTLLTFKAFNF
jgi:hypothetical protein